MRYVREFKGFAGVRLESDDIGSAFDPAVVLLHGPGQSRADWEGVAIALREAGRHAINVDLRGHGGSEWPDDARYDFNAYVEDVRAVLAQMRTRPVVVAASLTGWVAAAALAEDAATLAAGLVLVDLPETDARDVVQGLAGTIGAGQFDPRLFDRFDTSGASATLNAAAGQLAIPVLAINGALGSAGAPAAFIAQLPDVEAVAIEDSGLDRTETFNALLLDFLERKQPRFVPEFREGSDARTFRDALGCFATGVTII
ncbi:MAG: alpha/beta hydrolase, partial [Sphingorhabdus sp.]